MIGSAYCLERVARLLCRGGIQEKLGRSPELRQNGEARKAKAAGAEGRVPERGEIYKERGSSGDLQKVLLQSSADEGMSVRKVPKAKERTTHTHRENKHQSLCRAGNCFVPTSQSGKYRTEWKYRVIIQDQDQSLILAPRLEHLIIHDSKGLTSVVG